MKEDYNKKKIWRQIVASRVKLSLFFLVICYFYIIKEGVGGAYYNTIALCLAVTLMAPLSVQLKTKAPGARTFLQVIRTRFGVGIHCFCCVCALLINCCLIFEIGSRKYSQKSQILTDKTKNGVRFLVQIFLLTTKLFAMTVGEKKIRQTPTRMLSFLW